MTVISGNVGAPAASSIPDGTTTTPLLQGRQGELLDSSLHGTWYTQASRGKLFFATTATAGTVVPIQASSLASTFTLFNPQSSGVNLELVAYALGLLNATTVVSDISLWYQLGIGSTNAVLASLTGIASGARSTLLGGGSVPQALAYSAATFTGALLRGPTLATFGAVTAGVAGPVEINLNGRIIVPPGCAVTTAGNAAQTQAMQQTLYWVEAPV